MHIQYSYYVFFNLYDNKIQQLFKLHMINYIIIIIL